MIGPLKNSLSDQRLKAKALVEADFVSTCGESLNSCKGRSSVMVKKAGDESCQVPNH